MQTKTIKLYEYHELSPEAKAKALAKWNETSDDPFLQSHMINVLKEKLEDRGIEYDEDSIDVRYSLSHSQGDGFMFIGKVTWKGETITITHNGALYFHMYTADFDADGLLVDSEVEDFKAVYEAICKEMEQIGYDEIEYQQSEEAFEQACDANDFMFREDGTLEITN